MTSKRERYMKRRRELMDWCGQCVGFRAKGLLMPEEDDGHVCEPSDSCPKNCPGLALDLSSIEEELNISETAQEERNNNDKPNIANCYLCDKSEGEAVLIPCRTKGESNWVCTKCLPTLIHG